MQQANRKGYIADAKKLGYAGSDDLLAAIGEAIENAALEWARGSMHFESEAECIEAYVGACIDDFELSKPAAEPQRSVFNARIHCENAITRRNPETLRLMLLGGRLDEELIYADEAGPRRVVDLVREAIEMDFEFEGEADPVFDYHFRGYLEAVLGGADEAQS
jgi:hypothetical protein